jgi:hypoxanthine phosphoribosyltransferase
MSPRKHTVDATKGVLEIEWPFFGELSRGLALKVARAYDPELVIGIATAGVIPGAVIAAILGREFHSLVVSRKFKALEERERPQIFGTAPGAVRGKRVLIVDETCDSGDTLRLAISAVNEAGAAETRTAVSIRTGNYAPDFHAIATESTIILPWDREILIDGELRPNPLYAAAIQAAGR